MVWLHRLDDMLPIQFLNDCSDKRLLRVTQAVLLLTSQQCSNLGSNLANLMFAIDPLKKR